MAIRAAENHANGYAVTAGLPSSAFLLLAIFGVAYTLFGLLLFVWFCMHGTRGQNRFGADPLRN